MNSWCIARSLGSLPTILAFLPSKKKARWSNLFFYISVASISELKFEMHLTILHHISKCCTVMDPSMHGQWARPSLWWFTDKYIWFLEGGGGVGYWTVKPSFGDCATWEDNYNVPLASLVSAIQLAIRWNIVCACVCMCMCRTGGSNFHVVRGVRFSMC